MKKMKIIQLILLIATAVFVVIALAFCAIHLIWISRGVEANALYSEDGKITYIANGKPITVDAPYKSNKYKQNSYVKIYYNANNPTKCYSAGQIYRVFIFSGIAVIFMGATIVVSFYLEKSKNTELEELEEKEES